MDDSLDSVGDSDIDIAPGDGNQNLYHDRLSRVCYYLVLHLVEEVKVEVDNKTSWSESV